MTFTRKYLDVQFQLARGQFNGFGQGNQKYLQGLRVTAYVEQAGSPDMGKAVIGIFGMKLSDMNQLTVLPNDIRAVGQNFVTLFAYEDGKEPSLVFKGTITSAFMDAHSQPNVMFRVQAQGGAYEAVAPGKPTSVKGTADVAQTLQTIVNQMGYQFENNGVNCKVQNPYYWGSPRGQLKQLAKDAGISWVLEKDTVAIWPEGKSRMGGPIEISPQTGMRGYPTFTASGIEVATLFNPKVEYAKIIEVKSQLQPACGKWSVYFIIHELESELPNGRWFTNISASKVQA